jgi:hypothetical protein
MNESIITCPSCGTTIDISKSLYEKLSAKANADLKKEIEAHRAKYKTAMDDLKSKETQLKEKELELEFEVKKRTQKELERLLEEEKSSLEKELKSKITNQMQSQFKQLQEELDEKSKQVSDLNKTKLEIEKLRREKDELASKIKLEAELELNKQLSHEKEKIQKTIQEQMSMKLQEKEEQLKQIQRELENAKRKANQGSQQVQGEALEVAIEEWIRDKFPFDEVEEIKKGAYGADCIQTINTRELANCGKICYEIKNAKTFNREWITKLKQDMQKAKADLGVLVTTVYPKDMDRMGLVEGIWVCNFEEFKGSVALLREALIKVTKTLKKEENKSDKMTLLYNYLTGNEFEMQLRSIVEGFIKMREELEKEKRSMMASWKRREKLIEGVLENTTDMYGSLQGIAGNAIAHIEQLQLPYEDDE